MPRPGFPDCHFEMEIPVAAYTAPGTPGTCTTEGRPDFLPCWSADGDHLAVDCVSGEIVHRGRRPLGAGRPAAGDRDRPRRPDAPEGPEIISPDRRSGVCRPLRALRHRPRRSLRFRSAHRRLRQRSAPTYGTRSRPSSSPRPSTRRASTSSSARLGTRRSDRRGLWSAHRQCLGSISRPRSTSCRAGPHRAPLPGVRDHRLRLRVNTSDPGPATNWSPGS